jgi:hypothetical protein
MSTAQIDGYLPSLPGWDKENRSLVYAMIESGWTGRITSKGHWFGKAPDGTTKITVPSKNGNNRGLANAEAQFMRWLKAQAGTLPDGTPIIQTHRTGNPVVDGIVREGFVKKAMQALVPAPAVTLRPWLAKKQPGKQGGKTYESEAVLERTWPDGRVDYLCSKPDCGYESDNPRGVAAHYGKAHTLKGETPPASQDGAVHIDAGYTEPTTTRDYRPTQRLIDALAEFLTEHSWDNTDELAVLMLEWAHYRDDIEHIERTFAPLTDTDIVNRIRFLVGQPDQSEQIEILNETVDILSREVARLKDEKAALRDLLTEE